MKHYQATVVALVIALVAGCSKKPDADSPLAFAPATTPYVFANLKPLPKSVSESWFAQFAPLNDAYGQWLADLRAHPNRAPEEVRTLLPLLELLEGRLSYAGMEEMGFRHDGLAAFYGVDLVPVLRMELGSTQKFRALVADFEQRRGKTLETGKVEDQEYWRLGGDSGESGLILAIIGDHLVATLDVGAEGPPLARLLGLQRPPSTLLDSDELAAINDDHGLTPYGTFLLDTRRLAGALSGGEVPAMGLPSPTCQTELAGLAEAMPQILGGYEKIESKSMRMKSVAVLRDDLATALQAIPAPVPGLGGNDRSPFELGLGMHLDKLADFLQTRSGALTETPYRCEWLTSLNAGGNAQQLAPLYMAAGFVTGMRMTLSDVRWAGQMPESVSGALVAASPNPTGLVGMAQGFLPQLASLQLRPGGEPQQLDLGPMAALVPGQSAPYIAMSEQGLGVAVGDDASRQLQARLAAAPGKESPLFLLAYDGALYAQLMQAANTALAGLGGGQSSAADELLAQWFLGIDRLEFQVLATERGVEFRQHLTLK